MYNTTPLKLTSHQTSPPGPGQTSLIKTFIFQKKIFCIIKIFLQTSTKGPGHNCSSLGWRRSPPPLQSWGASQTLWGLPRKCSSGQRPSVEWGTRCTSWWAFSGTHTQAQLTATLKINCCSLLDTPQAMRLSTVYKNMRLMHGWRIGVLNLYPCLTNKTGSHTPAVTG